MIKDSKSFQIYPLWDLSLIKFPARNKLFATEPLGIGTPDAESFTGFLSRIARRHSVSATTLLRYVLDQHNTIEDVWTSNDFAFARHLNGLNDLAYIINNFFIQELKIYDVKFTTLLSLKNILSKHHLIRGKKMWCPLCLEEQKKNKIIYEKLVWSLAIVESCAIHKVLLVDCCPACGENFGAISSIHYGYCRFCFSWLGYCKKSKIKYQTKIRSKAIDPKLFWIDEEIGKIVELLPIDESKLEIKNFKKGLCLLVKTFTNGNASRFCRLAKIRENDFKELLQKDTLVSITQLINICYATNVSPSALLSGKLIEDLEDNNGNKYKGNARNTDLFPSQLYFERSIPKTGKVSYEGLNEAQRLILEVLNERIPWSFDKLCKTLNIPGEVLNRMHPELSLKIRRRYWKYKEKLHKNRWRGNKI